MTENTKTKDMDYLQREQTPLEKKRALRPIMKDQFHQDSLFGNSFRSKSFFVVHPEWLSEEVDNTEPEPLHRPPWPWEQPRYRQNIQYPITYKPDNANTEPEQPASGEQTTNTTCETLPEVTSSTTQMIGSGFGYTFTQPGIDTTRPYEKQTMFGAPVVDTTIYKSG